MKIWIGIIWLSRGSSGGL